MKPKPQIISPTPKMSMLECRNQYWKLARWAMDESLLTKDEAYAIARVGHRKEIYWGRHLLDLMEIIKDREKSNEVHTQV